MTKAKAAGRRKTNRHWRGAFLDQLAESSNVSASARHAGIDPSRAYKVRRAEPDFARLWRAALLEGYEHLEMELLHRLRSGEQKDGPKFDNAAALRLLILHRESAARERAIRDNMDTATARASLLAKLEAMRREVLARKAAEDAAG